MMRNKIAGFTLLEILIALSIFAILAVITASTLYYALNSKTRVAQQAEQLVTLQLALTLLERDIQQMIERPVLSDNHQMISEFIGHTAGLEWTHGGFINPFYREKRSTLERVAYLCQNQQLIRRSWPLLDIPDRSHYQDKLLLGNLETCRFAYFNKHLQLLDAWQANALSSQQNIETFPKAVQLTLNVLGWGEGRFLFIIPGALYHDV